MPVTTSDWKAWIDAMPVAEPTLHVTGMCHFATSGHKVALERAEPQGINPRDLLLRLDVAEPAQPGDMREHLQTEYTEHARPDAFDTVTILPDGPTVEVEPVT